MYLHLSTEWVVHLMFKFRKMIIWSVSSTGQVCFLPLPPNKEHESHCIYSNIVGFSSKALWKKKAPICLLLDSILKLMLHDGADPFRQSQNSWKVTGKRLLKGVNITFSSRACLTGSYCQIPPQLFLRHRLSPVPDSNWDWDLSTDCCEPSVLNYCAFISIANWWCLIQLSWLNSCILQRSCTCNIKWRLYLFLTKKRQQAW